MSKNIKKIVSMVAAIAIVAAMGIGAYAYFTDYATQEVSANAGTLGIELTQAIDLDGTINIVNPGDVAPFDFTVTNTAEKSVDVYAVVTVVADPAGEVETASPYKLLVNGSAAGFADTAEVTDVKVEKSVDNLTYTYTLPVQALIGSVEKDATLDGENASYKYEYEFGMDIDAINEWQDSNVNVTIEIFAKQHRNTASVTSDLEAWESAVRAELN